MAIVTLRIQLRRIDGRRPVDPSDLAAEVAQAVEHDLGEIYVEDVDGNEATYEVTRTDIVVHQLALGQPDETTPTSERSCEWCDTPMPVVSGGRPRRFHDDACRQAAHRAQATR
jgi:hypothetical protein